MIGRLWIPQLDVYDAVRRIASLLVVVEALPPPSNERLYIADFFLANPPLLHRTTMSRAVRETFNELNIPRPTNSFLNYPSAPLLFQKMSEVQRQALRTLIGKGLIDLELLKTGTVSPTAAGNGVFQKEFLPLLDELELKTAQFIATVLFLIYDDINVVRQRTGLRRTGR